MSEYVTPSGLVVHDRRDRAIRPYVDCVVPNDNDEGGTVGPNADVGFGDSYAMFPAALMPSVQPWQGWPVEWATPTWGSMVGLAEVTRRVSTVFGAIDKQAWQIATMPPYRTDNGVIIKPLAWMRNPQPEVYTGWIEAARQIMFSFLGAGEVFLWATSRFPESGRVRSWVMLNPGWVSVDLDGQIRRFRLGGEDITGDVLHIRYASWPGDARGHGPLEAAARAMFGAEALERYAANLAIRGGIPWGILTAPGNIQAKQAADLSSQYVAARLSAMGAPAVLGGGLKLETIAVNPKDMALLELREFEEARLAVLLGCPPTLLGLPSGEGSLTYNNVEHIYDFHWRSSLRPFAAMITEALSLWALADPEQAIELNRDEYTRPGLGERVAAYAALHGIADEGGPAISVAEIRAAERLDSAPGMRVASSLAVPS